MLASELYALSQNTSCQGNEKCHWCLGPCNQFWKHDDFTFLPFSKSPQLPKYPGGPWMCAGCWYWRRKSLTINWFGGGQQDKQEPKDHSWIIVENNAWGLKQETSQNVINWLLKPVLPFCLSIVTNNKIPNLIHLAVANDKQDLKADTPLHFTVDHILHSYTVYELEEALKRKELDGKAPGVRALINLYGPPAPPTFEELTTQVVNGSGRPGMEDERSRQNNMKRMKRPLR